MDELLALLQALQKAVEENGYNVKPGKLRQGCILMGPDATEEDYERAWAEIDAERAKRAKRGDK